MRDLGMQLCTLAIMVPRDRLRLVQCSVLSLLFSTKAWREAHTVHVAGNFWCAKVCKNVSRLFRRNFHGFYFHRMNVWKSDHIPTSWWPCPTCEPNKEHTWTLNNEVHKQACATTAYLPFVWPMLLQLRNYQHWHRGQETGLLNRRIHTADLSSTTLEQF